MKVAAHREAITELRGELRTLRWMSGASMALTPIAPGRLFTP